MQKIRPKLPYTAPRTFLDPGSDDIHSATAQYRQQHKARQGKKFAEKAEIPRVYASQTMTKYVHV